ncbi:MAG: hypothetical protein SGILL_007846 [Bacillariaceae sp.]
MGQEAAKTNLVERFVYSARTRGEYTGYILLLTDAPPERYDKLLNDTNIPNENFVVMTPLSAHYRTDFKQKDMVFKRFKTFVLEYVTADPRLKHVQLVYYLDVDIVVTEPMVDFFQGLERGYHIGTISNQTDTSTIWMFEGNADRVQVQGGQMILDVHQSAGCLSKWRKLIDKSSKTRKDQFPLMQMWKDQQKSKLSSCKIVRMAQDHFISFPSKQEVEDHVSEILEKSKTVNALNNASLIHIKNTGSAGNDVNETFHELFVRDILHFRTDQVDTLGITQKMHIKALKSDMINLDGGTH